MTRPFCILVAAMGGEGGGVLADWLVDVARHADHPAQATSIPGVAQRTGATTYYIEIFPQPRSALGGKRPVLSLNLSRLNRLLHLDRSSQLATFGAGVAGPEQ